MNLFAWIRDRRRAEKKITLSAKVILEDDISKIRCLADKCYFNQAYKGAFSCDLKEIQIDDTGCCRDFCDRRSAAKAIQQKGKAE